jgi:hypothetical protein
MIEMLHELLKQEPFSPFEISLTSGDKVRVDNPDLVVLEKSHLKYYIPRSDGVVAFRINQIVMLRSERN